jgi:hypothetical protein
MAFIGQEPVRCKITINDKIFEQVNEIKYLGCQISYEGERDVKNKNKIKISTSHRHYQQCFKTKLSAKIIQNEDI